jgi:hypothetical protein
MKIFLDINTNVMRTSLGGAAIRLLRLYRGNVLPLEVVLMDGNQQVTSTILLDGVSLKLAIAGYTRGSEVLIEQDSFSLSGEIATGTVDLSADALTDYFDSFVPSNAAQWLFKMEIQAVNDAGSFRQTYYSGQIVICREVISFSVHAPQAITDNSGTSITDNGGTDVTTN